jgi:hypothetical protein
MSTQHGDLVRRGDEFNKENWYHCARCGSAHAVDLPQCNGLRWRPGYGVPTGVVPRVEAMKGIDHFIYNPPLRRSAVAREAVLGPDPIQEAVDDYILMERKAKAWDALYAKAMRDWAQSRLADMDGMLSEQRP